MDERLIESSLMLADGALREMDGYLNSYDKGLIRLEQTAVPSAIEPGGAARVHLVFRPATEISAHWNNEAGDLAVWIDPPAGLLEEE